MKTKKMLERINWYRKDYVHDNYARIVEKFKNYERITKKKMIEEIYKVYDNYKNIIDICTTRELKYLEKVLNKKSNKELLGPKYEWERNTLRNKYLIQEDYDEVFVPDEIINKVEEALKNVNWETAEKLDYINEILVGYCKMQGSALLFTVAQIASLITGVEEKILISHMYHNKVFNYYVYYFVKDFPSIGKDMEVLLYQDYYGLEDNLEEERSKQGIAGSIPLDIKTFKTYFYNDFDIYNPKIKKLLEEIKKLPFFWNEALKMIRDYAVLNIDRTPLKEAFKSVPNLKNLDLTKFFKILDEAMDEMPSGALNGFTPNQAKEIKAETIKMNYEKKEKYVKQNNACLDSKDAKLFYKIYFGLLDFTNSKYKIKNNLKIYNKLGINPNEIIDIVEKFWENKDIVIAEFVKVNPFKFNKEELDITKEFKKGIRNLYIVCKFEEEYTGMMTEDRVYMIKGINDNIDNIINYEDLPSPVITTIIPFKGVLIYDSLFLDIPIKLGNDFNKVIEKDYLKSMKCYHL